MASRMSHAVETFLPLAIVSNSFWSLAGMVTVTLTVGAEFSSPFIIVQHAAASCSKWQFNSANVFIRTLYPLVDWRQIDSQFPLRLKEEES